MCNVPGELGAMGRCGRGNAMRTVAEVPSVFMPTSRALTTVETRALGSAGRTCASGDTRRWDGARQRME
jgi:hypothetical protein